MHCSVIYDNENSELKRKRLSLLPFFGLLTFVTYSDKFDRFKKLLTLSVPRLFVIVAK